MGLFDTLKSWFVDPGKQAELLQEPVLFFVPTQNFTHTFADGTVLGSYAKGMTYTVRFGNARLAALVERWSADGKVETFTTRPTAAVSGAS